MSAGRDKDFKMPVRVSAYLILGIALLDDSSPPEWFIVVVKHCTRHHLQIFIANSAS